MSQNSVLQQPMGAIVDITAELPAPKMVRYAHVKRGIDILGSLLLILLLFPVFVLICLAVRFTSRGPIRYRCARVGLGGKTFEFWKFRSMYVDADRRIEQLKSKNEKDGPIFKMKDDPRVTPVGRFLRKYSLDELPQLFNVLRGDMSLVGPRPPLPREIAQYDEYAMARLSVKPGITCYWQIMGRSDLTFQEWMDLDHRYLREMSFWTDVKILLRTPWAVIRGNGAY
jgi:exopolysaccharide biosynthesis polyprenyl glycosylphosphotransferase